MKDIAMKLNHIATTIALVSSTIAIAAHAQTPTCPVLSVTGLKPDQGTLMIAVYASEDSFFKKPVWMNALKVTDADVKVPVCNLDASEIAVTAFQDLNGNQTLDSNPMGIPSEPYAASGSPAMFGPPTWKDTKVTFKDAAAPIAIKF
jgi:uncharacterized protein (DUF2141 family)